MFARYANCLRLNLRMARLALGGRWLSPRQVAASYDRLAGDYDDAWLPHLWPVTAELLARLPGPGELPPGPLADLGCGTGHTTRQLCARYPDRQVIGVDLSPGMLAQARTRLDGLSATLVEADLEAWLDTPDDDSLGLIAAAWSIGYADSATVIARAARRLAPGGCFAFCVNLADTLAPLFQAYRRTMAAFPGQVQLALWPRFPRDWPSLAGALARHGLEVVWHTEGRICLPPHPAPRLPWLLRTGVLAGFDAVLPLSRDGPVADFFESTLAEALVQEPLALHHHYVSAVARKP